MIGQSFRYFGTNTDLFIVTQNQLLMPSSTQRFLALDVFRGMTICFMIIVNTPGGPLSYAPLEHARWNGFTPTDLVFPSFLFAVGNAMSFVMDKWAGLSQSQVLGKIFKRTLIIFLCGYLLYWFPFFEYDNSHHLVLSPISHTRILGVLQRIALCYMIGSLLIYYLKPRLALIISIIILLLYWPVMVWFGNPVDPLSLTGNAGLRLDRWLMGDNHLYHGEGLAFDPEGWLSTFPAVGNVVAGYIVGKFLQNKGKTFEGLAKLLLAGFVLLVVAYFWDLGFPINKKLWTSSFVVYTTGLDCIIISLIIYVVDFMGKTKWTNFFTVVGKNPLFIYLLSEIGATVMEIIPAGNSSLHGWVYQHVFKYAGAYFGSLLGALTFMMFCWLIGYFLDKRKIYVRV
jgi:predicted acyltransferase